MEGQAKFACPSAQYPLVFRARKYHPRWKPRGGVHACHSPGSGKTLLARATWGILPEMSKEASLDVTRIYSVADLLPAGTPLIRHRPFRASLML
jgi:hypothetical protein